jgi:outer membrane assembly lipoprotein YfiO
VLSRSKSSSNRSSRIGQLILPALIIAFSGCWGSSEPQPEQEAKEIKSGDNTDLRDEPEAKLLRESKKLYQSGMFTIARESLATLKDRYPMGAYATFAEIKHADTYFFNREYNQAAKFYEAFLTSHPASAEIPYVKLQAARSHVSSARDQGRDRQPWERGLTLYDEVAKSYPGTEYASVAASERIPVIEELAAYDREIIEYYRSQGNQAAVAERAKNYQQRWGSRLPADSPLALTPLETDAAAPLPSATPTTDELIPSTSPESIVAIPPLEMQDAP